MYKFHINTNKSGKGLAKDTLKRTIKAFLIAFNLGTIVYAIFFLKKYI